MKLLALDTATENCSAALWLDGQVTERVQAAPKVHAEQILPMVQALLSVAGLSLSQLDALAFGRGPGGFTGVRVAAAVIQGLAFGAGLPVVPVSDLMALAARAQHAHGVDQVLACLDARMGEVYWCAYTASAGADLTPCLEERLGIPDTVSPPVAKSWFGAGSGFAAYGTLLQARLGTGLQGYDDALLPAARDVAMLAVRALARGEMVAAEEALPVYLRDRVAWPKSAL
ncbi:MAG: tRNA (adenosine(37)-N6)-threonylcarbamoyltransferase complex dimerization subunit type 1 TsaB [Gammaproteobacteria bacterium]|nr:tRNA (adenosine(37)-N6)-threonylcarbamoyltransferase complex dimerization subunit type 1 TsaB [Gammaproteobacteria bacterium]